MYDFSVVKFSHGSHASRDDGMCVMEAASFISGEEHSDSPECVCPVLGAFAREWNDGLPDDESRARWLGPFLWRLPGTKFTREIEMRRGELVLDWLVRIAAPMSLDLVPQLVQYAVALRGLPEITAATVGQASPILSAAWSAAWSAAESAAWSAAWSAARSAAESAARSAARSAAESALQPLIDRSQVSASELLDRCIRLTEPQEIVRPDHEFLVKSRPRPAVSRLGPLLSRPGPSGVV